MTRLAFLLLVALTACSAKPTVPAHNAASSGPVTTAVARGVVEAQGGLLRILAPRDGQVVAALAEEGDQVASDQVIAQMDDRQARLALDAANAELAGQRAQIEVAAARADGAERDARHLAALAATDAATRQESDAAVTAAAVARGELHQAASGLLGAQAKQRLAAYEVEVRSVRAPRAGRLVRRIASAGAYVAAATPLFVLEAGGQRIVHAELDASLADRVHAGMRAAVSREFEYGKVYTARVLRVSDVLAGPALVDDASARADARVVNVLLTLPPSADLRLGQRVLVRFAP